MRYRVRVVCGERRVLPGPRFFNEGYGNGGDRHHRAFPFISEDTVEVSGKAADHRDAGGRADHADPVEQGPDSGGSVLWQRHVSD